ncbi:MAG: hypothetical protein WBA46_09455 [Thermomicrobiales bacterium]
MTVKQGRCRSCGRPIRWGITTNGKQMPLDAEWEDVGVPGKTWVFEGESQRVRPYEPLFDAGVTEHFEPHWTSCPHADEHRSRR